MEKIKNPKNRDLFDVPSLIGHQLFKYCGSQNSIFYFNSNVNGQGNYNRGTGLICGIAFDEKGTLIGMCYTQWSNLIPVDIDEIISVWPELEKQI